MKIARHDVARHLGFNHCSDGQLSLRSHGRDHIINFSDVEAVVEYLYMIGFKVVPQVTNKDHAIGFAEWIREQYWKRDDVGWFRYYKNYYQNATTNELYKKYIKMKGGEK